MERTMISWNVPNWITIMLMAAAGYAVLGLVRQVMIANGAGGGTAPSGIGGY
jgi:hypothetical protein